MRGLNGTTWLLKGAHSTEYVQKHVQLQAVRMECHFWTSDFLATSFVTAVDSGNCEIQRCFESSTWIQVDFESASRAHILCSSSEASLACRKACTWQYSFLSLRCLQCCIHASLSLALRQTWLTQCCMVLHKQRTLPPLYPCLHSIPQAVYAFKVRGPTQINREDLTVWLLCLLLLMCACNNFSERNRVEICTYVRFCHCTTTRVALWALIKGTSSACFDVCASHLPIGCIKYTGAVSTAYQSQCKLGYRAS